MRKICQPSSANRHAWRWSEATRGQVASIAASPRRAASRRTEGETPCALKRTVAPSGISSIYSRVFKNAGITTLYLPKSVTEIRDDAFLGSAIKTVYYEGSASDWAAITVNATGNDELAAAIHLRRRKGRLRGSALSGF